MTRGQLNNNPGNIRHGDQWQGLADEQTDPDFCTFTAPEYGIRAIMIVLNSYAKRKISTVKGIIEAWAPPSENDTDAYVADMASRLGIKPTDNLVHPMRGSDGGPTITPKLFTQDKHTVVILAKAIIHHENGVQPYPETVFNKAWDLAKL